MNAAGLFWFLTMESALLAFFAVLILIGSIFGHRAVGDPISTVILGLLLGVFVFAAASYGFTIVRSMYLSDGLLTPAVRPGSNAGPSPPPSPSSATR